MNSDFQATALKSLGIEPVTLTGYNQRTAEEIARQLEIERVFAEVLPSGKVDIVQAIQREGKRVAVIGDCINHAPALTAAEVGIAVGSGTDLALEAGSVVLIGDNMRAIVATIQIVRKIVSKIRAELLPRVHVQRRLDSYCSRVAIPGSSRTCNGRKLSFCDGKLACIEAVEV